MILLSTYVYGSLAGETKGGLLLGMIFILFIQMIIAPSRSFHYFKVTIAGVDYYVKSRKKTLSLDENENREISIEEIDESEYLNKIKNEKI